MEAAIVAAHLLPPRVHRWPPQAWAAAEEAARVEDKRERRGHNGTE